MWRSRLRRRLPLIGGMRPLVVIGNFNNNLVVLDDSCIFAAYSVCVCVCTQYTITPHLSTLQQRTSTTAAAAIVRYIAFARLAGIDLQGNYVTYMRQIIPQWISSTSSPSLSFFSSNGCAILWNVISALLNGVNNQRGIKGFFHCSQATPLENLQLLILVCWLPRRSLQSAIIARILRIFAFIFIVSSKNPSTAPALQLTLPLFFVNIRTIFHHRVGLGGKKR